MFTRIVWKTFIENALQQRLINVAITNKGQKRQLRRKFVQTYAYKVELYTPTSDRKNMKEHRHTVHKYVQILIHTYIHVCKHKYLSSVYTNMFVCLYIFACVCRNKFADRTRRAATLNILELVEHQRL